MRRTRIGLVGIAMVIILTLVYVQSQVTREAVRPNLSPANPELLFKKTVTTQQRLNRHFHGDVVPKLKKCWGTVSGRGKVDFTYTYIKATSGRWVFDTINVRRSELPPAQTAVALQCMENSVRSTSFAAESGEASHKSFVAHWSWPVPFPADADQQRAAMFAASPSGGSDSGGGVGCDGRGTTAACYECSGLKCIKVCVGWRTCSADGPRQSGRVTIEGTCTVEAPCASGGPFTAGGRVIASATPSLIDLLDPAYNAAEEATAVFPAVKPAS